MTGITDTTVAKPPFRGRRRLVIIGLAILTAVAIVVPGSAPWAGSGAILLLTIGLWRRADDAKATRAREHREPSLWDDGFGAT